MNDFPSAAPAFQSWEWKEDHFAAATHIPLSHRAFRYGMSLFESLRVCAGKPEFLEAHLLRLLQAAESTGFHLNDARRVALRRSQELVQGIPLGMMRIYLTAEGGPPGASAGECGIFVLAETREKPEAQSYRVALDSIPYLAPFSGAAGGLKTGNYWANASALQRALAAGAQEALLFHPKGELASACMANVFLKVKGRWLTPRLESGARPGVIRELCIRRLHAIEARCLLEEVESAEAAFLTSSWLGVVPVDSLGGRTLAGAPELVSLQDWLGAEAAAGIAKR